MVAENRPVSNRIETEPTVGVLFLGRKREGFDPSWGRHIAERVRTALDNTGLSWHEPEVNIVDDKSLAAAVDVCIRERVDALVTLQTTMSDARMARTLSQIWQHPVILWATPEKPDGTMISSNSLVGVHNWASNLFHYEHKFELVYGDPEDGRVIREFCRAVRIVYAERRLRSTKIGIVGGQAPGFFTMAPDPNALHAHMGVQVQQYTLPQYYEIAEAVIDEDVAADVKQVHDLNLPLRNIGENDLEMASRLYLGLKRFSENEGADALALRCWPELPNRFGQWPYFGMSRLADSGFGIAMEGDGDGALTATLGWFLGCGPCYLTDWLEHDVDTITFWHAGNIPFSLSPEIGSPGGPRLTTHFNNKKPVVIESIVRPEMPVTIVRLWNRHSEYLCTAWEGVTRLPRRELMGSQCVVEFGDFDPRIMFDTLCHEGMPHHVALFEGNQMEIFRRWSRMSGVIFKDCR